MKQLRFALQVNNAMKVFLLPMLFISAILFMNGCGNENLDEIEAFEEEMNAPAEIGKDVELIYSDSGYVKARVTAPKMERYISEESSQLEMPDGLKAWFYDKEFKVVSTIRADYGIRYTNQERTELKDNVVVVNEEGDSLQTEHLIWDESQDKIYSEKYVRVRTEDEIINAQGFESDLSFSNYKFYKITDSQVLVETEE